MMGFSKDWLSLREAADAEARDGTLLTDLDFGEAEGVRIIDLGAGSGSNLRYLAPRLESTQHWTMIDCAPELLSAIGVPETARPITVETLQRDLAVEPEDLPLEGYGLVTASAFFDLVSEEWLRRFVDRCTRANMANGLFALTVDGTIIWSPQDPEDTEIESMFNAHMRCDKGFGPALGPEAAEKLASYFEAAGYKVRMAETPWRIGAEHAELQMRLLEGYVSATCDRYPEEIDRIRDWAARRALYIAQGQSALFVGHRDVLVQRA